MSDASPPIDPRDRHADNEIVQRLASLQMKTETFRVELEVLQQELAELVELPEEGPVSASFDSHGALVSLDIDREASADLTPKQLIAEINYGIARASQNQPTFGGTMSDGANIVGDSTSSFLDQLLASATSGLSSEPNITKNDLNTVTITTIAGSLVAIDCSESWIGSTSASSIAQEVIRVATQALEEDDPMGRRTKKESHG